MKKIILISCFLLSISGKGFCQIDPVFMAMQSSTYMSNFNLINSNTERFNEERRRNEIRLGKRESSGVSTPNAKPIKAADPKSFLFSPDHETSLKVKQTIIDNEKKRHPNTVLEEALNDKNNPLPNYIRLLKSLGLDVQHNYADAFTAYMLGMWRIANKMDENPGIEQIKNVRSQVISTINVSRLSNMQKQQEAEYLMYSLIFANEPYESFRKKGNKKQLQQDADVVYNRFLKQNMDLRRMTITAEGLKTTK